MDRRAFHEISYGLYMVASSVNGKLNGQIANTVFQVSNDPPTLAVSLNKLNLTHEFVLISGGFAVSVLSQDTPLSLIGRFGFKSGRDLDKFNGISYGIGQTGMPYLTDNCLVFLEALVKQTVDVYTHTIFIGEVVGAEIVNSGTPMTYAHYHLVKKGNVPKGAPVPVSAEAKTRKYTCRVCGYVYDPEVGDPEAGIPPGTSFDDLPNHWVCPVCGVGKDYFDPEGS